MSLPRLPYHLCKTLFSRYAISTLAFLSIGLFLLWSGTASIDIFVNANGRVTSDSDHKIIEHLEGGILSELHTSEGQKVTKGMLLFVIESPKLIESTEILEKEWLEKSAKVKRLFDEIQTGEIKETDLTSNPETSQSSRKDHYQQNERRLFKRRQQTLDVQKSIFDQKIHQKQSRYRESQQTVLDLRQELSVAQEQQVLLETLINDRAGSRVMLLEKRMDVLKIQTQINQTTGKQSIIEAELQALKLEKKQLEADFKEKVQSEYNQETAEIAQLESRIKALKQRKTRSEIRSPVNGTLYRLVTSTPGEVVSPGTIMAEIVPDNEPLQIEAELPPHDRARIWVGQQVNIRVSAYDYSIHGTLNGTIQKISADTHTNEAFYNSSRENFYKVTISSDSNGFGPDKPLMQGMTVDINIISGQQTVMSYLLPAAYSNRR